jgi:xanthine dehydrogenase small subunit
MKIKFLLNDLMISDEQPGGMTLLDYIRYVHNLRGTKIGCREGDCGACTVLIGTPENDRIGYQSATSCLTPLANVYGKHVVTIEGLNIQGLNKAQDAMVRNSATQCGFCTPGFVVSLCGYALGNEDADIMRTFSPVDGNICRCTGYKSIERATEEMTQLLKFKDRKDPVKWLVENEFVPRYFLDAREKLKSIEPPDLQKGKLAVGGGTDLYVQIPDEIDEKQPEYMFNSGELKGIYVSGNRCIVKASATATDLLHNRDLLKAMPRWQSFFRLISSTPIRNIGTVAGNLVNASPIGDITIILLALNADITLADRQDRSRSLPLKNFYKGYKSLDKKDDEIVTGISFILPDKNVKFNFEKVSKRTTLDIASVNTAISLSCTGSEIHEAHCSIGGVAPVPLYLHRTSEALTGKNLSGELIQEVSHILQEEISPISDVRGSSDYKRLLARQLFFSHFIELFPEMIRMEELV